MRDQSLSLRGESVRALPRKNRTWAEGRTCAEADCSTRLSIYNRAKYCWAHAPTNYYVLRGRKKSPQAA
ncbi:MAG: hypothetical protein ABR518_10500 [Actinomycetota bacterium]